MTVRYSTILSICTLIAVGGWGVWKIADNNGSNDGASSVATTTPVSQSKRVDASNTRLVEKKTVSLNDNFDLIRQKLIDGHYEAAVDQANLIYSGLNSNQANKLKNIFIAQAQQLQNDGQTRNSLSLLKSFSQYFNELDAWDRMGQLAVSLNNYPVAVDAYIRYSILEHRPDLLERKLIELTKVANLYKTELQKNDDYVSVRDLFQRLYEAHPTHAHFQLSLAEAQISLKNFDAARQILDVLQYDPELGNLAKQVLAQINDERQRKRLDQVAKQTNNTQASDIVVPLTKVGTSFVANINFNNRPVPMLLDTGASITSLSAEAIQRLGLEPLGRSIQINTANGRTEAPLYRVKRISLGRFRIQDLVVAEIDLGRDNRFQGLLGTDLLNGVNQNYGYLIDNQKSELIFRRR